MKNVIIDFLNDLDHNEPIYTAARDLIDVLQPFITRLKSVVEVYDFLKTINSDDDWVMITFIAHANTEYLGMISPDGTHHKLNYPKLLHAVDQCVTNYNVYLNLIGNCESYGIERYLTTGLKISEAWVSKIKTPTARMALKVAFDENFETLNNDYTRNELKGICKRLIISQ